MNRQRVHLDLLRSRYPDCAESLVRELGKERQGPTVLFEDYGGEAFKKITSECDKPIPLTAKRVLHGAAGLVKAALNLDPVTDEVREQRLAICHGCEFWTTTLKVERCAKCGCATQAKIRNASESCPLNPPKWGPVRGNV